jgi:hypothetical protein
MTVSRQKFLLIFFAINLTLVDLHGQLFKNLRTADGIEISEKGSKVLFYQAQPKSLNGQFERANYIHPLYSLDGTVLTEDFPQDHLHQRGIFWTWHQVLFNEKKIADGWTCENISWDVRDLKIRKNKKRVILSTMVFWKSFLKSEKVAIVRETAKIIVYRSTDQYRIIDFNIELSALIDSLKIGGSDDAKGYSGFSLRLMLPADIHFSTNNKEVIPQELGIDTGPWMDFTGSFDGTNSDKSGIAVFCHPSNPGYPHPWILRKEKSMQNPAYPGRIPVELPRKGLRSQYRLIIHKSTITNDDLKNLYNEYEKDAR